MKLLLGADGFIGKNLHADIRISRKDADLRDPNALRKIIDIYRPQTVISCAGVHSFFSSATSQNHTDVLFSNLRIDMNVIECCLEFEVPNLILLSSTSALGGHPAKPFITEQDRLVPDPSDFRFFGYATSKIVQPDLCRAAAMTYGLNYRSIYLGNMYGPHARFNKESTAIASIFYQILEAKINDLSHVSFFGDGLVRRNWTYIGDLRQILDSLIEIKSNSNPVIVSSMEIHNLRYVSKKIADSLGYVGDLIFQNSEEGIPTADRIVSNENLLSEIGPFEFTNLESGIFQTAEWIARHPIFPR